MKDLIALFSCAKNEHIYITEWIYYHLKIGFDHIFVCDTSDDSNMKNCTFNLDSRITLLKEPLNGREFGHLQYNLQTKYNESIKKTYKWCSFIDIDEFIVLKQHKLIKDFLKSINFNTGSLGINWVLFGNNNEEKYNNKPVIKRFTKCDSKYDRHIKCIVDTNSVEKFTNQHFAVLSKGNQVNEKGNIYKIGPWQDNSSIDFIQINHYVVKSTEEYLKRTKNHHCRTADNIEHFRYHNRNNITDLTAYNFLLRNTQHKHIDEIDYEFYVQYYDDLLINGIFNKDLAYKHFKTNNEKESRICNLNFDYNYYKLNNSDLTTMTNIQLWNHFKNNGLKEKRKYKHINQLNE